MEPASVRLPLARTGRSTARQNLRRRATTLYRIRRIPFRTTPRNTKFMSCSAHLACCHGHGRCGERLRRYCPPLWALLEENRLSVRARRWALENSTGRWRSVEWGGTKSHTPVGLTVHLRAAPTQRLGISLEPKSGRLLGTCARRTSRLRISTCTSFARRPASRTTHLNSAPFSSSRSLRPPLVLAESNCVLR